MSTKTKLYVSANCSSQQRFKKTKSKILDELKTLMTEKQLQEKYNETFKTLLTKSKVLICKIIEMEEQERFSDDDD